MLKIGGDTYLKTFTVIISSASPVSNRRQHFTPISIDHDRIPFYSYQGITVGRKMCSSSPVCLSAFRLPVPSPVAACWFWPAQDPVDRRDSSGRSRTTSQPPALRIYVTLEVQYYTVQYTVQYYVRASALKNSQSTNHSQCSGSRSARIRYFWALWIRIR
jgi:hypothetical protein